MTQAIHFVLSVILTLAELVLAAIAVADGFLASLMHSAGVPPNLQILLLVIVAVMLALFAFRALGGVFGLLLVVLLLLLIAHRMFPGMQVPHSLLPPDWQHSGSVQL